MSDPPSGVRVAVPGDEDAIYALLLELERDNGLGFPSDETTVREFIRRGTERRRTERRGGLIGVIDAPDQPGRLAGSVCVDFGVTWYSTMSCLFEHWLFVAPPYRKGTGFADTLMRWISWYRDGLEAASGKEIPLFSAVSSRRRLKVKERWWARRGERIGSIFLVR